MERVTESWPCSWKADVSAAGEWTIELHGRTHSSLCRSRHRYRAWVSSLEDWTDLSGAGTTDWLVLLAQTGMAPRERWRSRSLWNGSVLPFLAAFISRHPVGEDISCVQDGSVGPSSGSGTLQRSCDAPSVSRGRATSEALVTRCSVVGRNVISSVSPGHPVSAMRCAYHDERSDDEETSF